MIAQVQAAYLQAAEEQGLYYEFGTYFHLWRRRRESRSASAKSGSGVRPKETATSFENSNEPGTFTAGQTWRGASTKVCENHLQPRVVERQYACGSGNVIYS